MALGKGVVGAARVVLGVDDASFKKGLASARREFGHTSSSLERDAHRTGKAFSTLGTLAAGAVVGGVGLLAVALKKSIDAAVDAERVQVKLQVAVKNAGLSFAEHGRHIDDVIQKHSRLSGLDDEELSESFSNLIRTTKDVNAALDLNALAADIARTKGMDLAGAGQLLARVYNGNLRGLKSLGLEMKPVTEAQDALRVKLAETRVEGEKLTPQQKEQIIQLQRQAKETDALATRQGALAKLQTTFGGQAAAYGKTAAGAQDRFRVAVENLEESLGKALLPTLTRLFDRMAVWAERLEKNEKLHRQLRSAMAGVKEIAQGVADAVKEIAPKLATMARAIDTVVEKVGGWERAVKTLFALWAAAKVATMVTRIGLLTGALGGIGGGANKAKGRNAMGGGGVLGLLFAFSRLPPAVAIPIVLTIVGWPEVKSTLAEIEGWLQDHGIPWGRKGRGGPGPPQVPTGPLPPLPPGVTPIGASTTFNSKYKATFGPEEGNVGARARGFANALAGAFGKNLDISSGQANHGKYTTSGNVSEHYSGNAVDIPATGDELTQLGQTALILAGMDPAQARREMGGVYNVNGYQILFNTTVGGNHWNHVHVGVSRALGGTPPGLEQFFKRTKPGKTTTSPSPSGTTTPPAAPPASGGGTTTTTTDTAEPTIDEDVAMAMRIDKLIGSRPMRGLGAVMAQAGKKYGVDPRFIAAVAGAETEFGRTGLGRASEGNNAFGFIGYRFGNYTAAIYAFAKLMATGTGSAAYFTAGKTNVGDIIARYSPVGAANDPKGTNAQHPANIASILKGLGGDPSDVTFSTALGDDPTEKASAAAERAKEIARKAAERTQRLMAIARAEYEKALARPGQYGGDPFRSAENRQSLAAINRMRAKEHGLAEQLEAWVDRLAELAPGLTAKLRKSIEPVRDEISRIVSEGDLSRAQAHLKAWASGYLALYSKTVGRLAAGMARVAGAAKTESAHEGLSSGQEIQYRDVPGIGKIPVLVSVKGDLKAWENDAIRLIRLLKRYLERKRSLLRQQASLKRAADRGYAGKAYQSRLAAFGPALAKVQKKIDDVSASIGEAIAMIDQLRAEAKANGEEVPPANPELAAALADLGAGQAAVDPANPPGGGPPVPDEAPPEPPAGDGGGGGSGGGSGTTGDTTPAGDPALDEKTIQGRINAEELAVNTARYRFFREFAGNIFHYGLGGLQLGTSPLGTGTSPIPWSRPGGYIGPPVPARNPPPTETQASTVHNHHNYFTSHPEDPHAWMRHSVSAAGML